jgi:hypothetical protein
MSGGFTNKEERLGYQLIPWEKLQFTRLVKGADSTLETVVFQELKGISHEYGSFVHDVAAFHGQVDTVERQAMLFTTSDGQWRCQRECLHPGNSIIYTSHPNNFITTFCYH